MDYSDTLSVSQFVRNEKMRIEKEEMRLKGERAHLDWLLEKIGLATTAPAKSFDLSGLTIQRAIEQILDEAFPKSLMSKDILHELNTRANKSLSLPNMHAHMSRLALSETSKVCRKEIGYYSVKKP